MRSPREEVESGFCGPKNGKTKIGFFMRMLRNGSIYATAMKEGNKFIKRGDIDRFCDEAVAQIEELRHNWKEKEKGKGK